jgi:cation diffusion facilitator CzcD-associated flavoprotein CzcO
MRETAAIHGIDRHVQFHHTLLSADWSSKKQSWRLTVSGGGETKYINARFLIMGTGYYDYEEPLSTTIPGIKDFKGTVVHPQFWPEDLDYANKKIVVIGSGATAVTLLPSLAKKASQVTMLQRSPSYFLSLPNPKGSWTERWLPQWLSCKLNRAKFLLMPYLFFQFCRVFPNAARRLLRSATISQIPETVPYSPHFEPTYNPWEQRLCICPDGDFFKCLHKGNADIATGHIKTITEKGILLESGNTLDTDIIVTATGLKIRLAGGARVSIDGQRINIADKFLWKAVMLQDVPNCAFVIGYTNASWTLGADTTALLVCRLLQYMRSHGFVSAVPKLDHPETVKSVPVLNLKSTYIMKAAGTLPKSGDSGPWRPRANYFTDHFNAKFGDISTGLQFSKVLS